MRLQTTQCGRLFLSSPLSPISKALGSWWDLVGGYPTGTERQFTERQLRHTGQVSGGKVAQAYSKVHLWEVVKTYGQDSTILVASYWQDSTIFVACGLRARDCVIADRGSNSSSGNVNADSHPGHAEDWAGHKPAEDGAGHDAVPAGERKNERGWGNDGRHDGGLNP
jgi:hypothetical protein